MRLQIHAHDGTLADALALAGHPVDLRCGGAGTCGRCRVTLCSGEWSVDGEAVTVPVTALACRTRLAGSAGEVEIADSARAVRAGKVAADWNSRPLEAIRGTVIGIDIGTTTIAAIKIADGNIVGRAGCYNRQSRFGDNVITRINYAAAHLHELQQDVLDSIRELLEILGSGGVERIALSGNTVMSCLVHGIDPTSIGVIPFTPPVREFPERRDLFGPIPVLTIPAISGYVGGDLTAGLGETALAVGEMLVDIGTNCEIIYHAPGGLVCTAAAAGPAFEGAGIGCGCRAIPGAIDHYYGPGDYSVLGDRAACGLCGSAMIDFLAVEHRAERLNMFGRIMPKAESCPVAPGVTIYECDIEQLLKAKAAVWAGIKTLEDHTGTPAQRIYLAGGFAQYLDVANAIAIGMLPAREYRIVGNTSLAGAARLAVNPAYAGELLRLSNLPQEIPLNQLPPFEDNYIDGLLLPE